MSVPLFLGFAVFGRASKLVRGLEQPRCDDVMQMVLALQIRTFELVSSPSW